MDKSTLSNNLTLNESGLGASFFNDKSLRQRKNRGAYRRKHLEFKVMLPSVGWPNVPVKTGNRVHLKIMNTSGYTWKSSFEMVVECYKQKKKIPIDRDIGDKECWEVDFEFFDCKESGKHKASFGVIGVGKENGEQIKYASYKTKFTADVKEADAGGNIPGTGTFGEFIAVGNSLNYSSTLNNDQTQQSKLDSEKEDGPRSGNQGKDWEIIVSPSRQPVKK